MRPVVLPTPEPEGYTPEKGHHGRDAYAMLHAPMKAYPVIPTPNCCHVGSLDFPLPLSWGATLTPPVLPQWDNVRKFFHEERKPNGD